MPELQGTATLRQIIGANLEKARRDMQLSQQAFGARLIQWLPTAWSPQAVSLAERGNRAFGADDLLALSVGLRVPVPYFLMPPPEVQVVVTASGMVELPREQFVDEVVGTGASRSQLERARMAGRAEAFEEMAAMLAERREAAQTNSTIEDMQEVGKERHGVGPVKELQDAAEEEPSIPSTVLREEVPSIPSTVLREEVPSIPSTVLREEVPSIPSTVLSEEAGSVPSTVRENAEHRRR